MSTLVPDLPIDTDLAAVVFHQCGSHIDMVPCANVLSGFLENGAARLDPLCPPGKLHVLNVNLFTMNDMEPHQPINCHIQ